MPAELFAVSSGPGLPGFEELRSAIKHSISDPKEFPELGKAIPCSYMVLRDNLRAVRAAGLKPMMEWEEYAAELAEPAKLAREDDLIPATNMPAAVIVKTTAVRSSLGCTPPPLIAKQYIRTVSAAIVTASLV